MKLHRTSRSSLFLLELLFAILFFIVAAVLCVRIFVTAHLLSQNAQSLTLAWNLADNAAALIRDTDHSLEETALALEEFFPDAQKGDSADGSLLYRMYYDSFWNTTSPSSAAYTASISVLEEGHTRLGLIVVTDKNKEEYCRLPLTVHLPLRLSAQMNSAGPTADTGEVKIS